MPTGTPIRDIRQQLLDAAERILVRDGPDAVTSRAVTNEAGVAKGILHRHFPDFDTFLATLVLAHTERLDSLSTAVRASAGTGTLTDNLTHALVAALNPSAIRTVSLICSRRSLLAKLRLTTPTGLPLLAETTKMITAYLTAERGLGRIPLHSDVDALAVILVGSAHLLAASSCGATVKPNELSEVVETAVASAAQHRPSPSAQT